MPSEDRPYNLDEPADVARLFRETREFLGYSRFAFNPYCRLAWAAFDDLLARMEGQPAAPPVCPRCYGDRVVRVQVAQGDWDDMPCEVCSPHDEFGRPIDKAETAP